MGDLPDGWTVRRVPFRDGSDDDLGRMYLVESEVESERRPDRTPQPLDSYIAFARSFPDYYGEWSWLVESDDGTPLATGVAWYRSGDDPSALHCDFMVRAAWRRRGIGSHLVGLVCDTAESEKRPLLLGSSLDTIPAGEAFARLFAGRPGLVTRTSELRLDEVDWAMVDRWAGEGPQRAPGYTLQAIDGPYPPELYDDVIAFHDIMETAPRDDLEVATSHIDAEHVAQADRSLVESGRTRWTLFARDPDGKCVGGTDVTFEPWEPATVLQGNTGIDPAHRGQGLGKWVKAAMLQRVRAQLPEAKRVRTGNAYSNAPMLAINDALGFKIINSRTEWQADLAEVRRSIA